MDKHEVIVEKVNQFVKDRDWDQFHTPKNLIMALFKEVGELGELFQWKDSQYGVENLTEHEMGKIEDEISDIYIYLIRLSTVLRVDLHKSSLNKIKKNELKYPVERFKGISKKYNEI